ncbi:NAD(P)/FAD-dependent oxidoreductase [Halobacillus rhizosphaerae]|uniref:NAD(P)/FAD-dependent oxidoreductase n=1 Tax=Halobacillus rhizosphaerae TaxID=3064889 RepID=UPI00398A9082
MKEESYDITIIGAGPVGLFTAFYAGMRNVSVKVIDALPQVGGQLAALYPEKYIYDVGGFPDIKAQDLVDRLYQQAEKFSPSYCLEESVERVVPFENGTFQLITDKKVHYTKAIIITAGAGAFQPRKLKVKEASNYENNCLHYSVKELKKFRDKNVLVCGGGDSAVDWALALERIAKKVTLVHRRNNFRSHEHSLNLLKDSRVDVKTPYQVERIIGNNNVINQVFIQEVKGNNYHFLDIDDLIINYGFVTSIGPMKSWGINLEKNSIKVNAHMETSVPGIFAAGDVCSYEGKTKLIASGFGEAPTAVNYAKKRIDPESRLQAGHSTSIFASAGK